MIGFDCGCEFETFKDDTGAERIILDINSIPFTCRRTWRLIGTGHTKGIFQLESQLGRSWAARIKPESIEDLAAIGSLLRPGCLRAMSQLPGEDKPKSMTERYADRKSGIEEVTVQFEILRDVLDKTYNVLCYQEQSMQIAQRVAGFDLQKADILRKAIGKKLADQMAKVKKMFIDGAIEHGAVSKEDAEEIFGWIEQSQRYSFNKSHAVSYAINGYWSAYCKSHFPLEFYTSWLYHSQFKQKPQDEIRELISDARIFDVEITTPDFRTLQSGFHIHDGTVRFGLSDIKGIGDKQIVDLRKVAQSSPIDVNNAKWPDLLILSNNIRKDVFQGMILGGALDFTGEGRRKMEFEYKKYQILNDVEKDFLSYKHFNEKSYGNILEMMDDVLHARQETTKLTDNIKVTKNINRFKKVESLIKSLKNPPTSLKDTPEWVSGNETKYLGMSLTCNIIDGRDTSAVNCTCKDFVKKNSPSTPVIAGQILSVREITIKNGRNRGKKMAFMSIDDGSACLEDIVIFSDSWYKYNSLLFAGNTVQILGKRDKNRGSFIVNKAWQV